MSKLLQFKSVHPLLISFGLGLLLVFAYAPFSQWWLPFIILPLWFNQLNYSAPKRAAKQGFAFALGWFGSGISWVHVSIDQFGGLPLVISLLLMLLLCAYLAIFPALSCYFSAKLSFNRKANLVLFIAFWFIAEYCRAHFLTGFPWLSLGYSQIDGPLAHWAPVIGEIGITFLILLISTSIYLAWDKLYQKNNAGYVYLVFLLIMAVATYWVSSLTWVKPNSEKIKVALIQGNISQDVKWAAEEEWPTLLTYLDLTRLNYDADIIVWPESAIPAIESAQHIQNYLDMANQSAALNQSAIITGVINYDFDTQEYFNTLITLGLKKSGDKIGDYSYNHANRYAKNHLLPIGEFVPFQDFLRPLAPFFNLPMSSFSRGDYVQKNLTAKGIKILPLICFEIAFPGQLAANMDSDTQVLLTVSNDAWFGDSHGPHQHLEIARMRALEFGRPLIRTTNTGITAIVNHLGNITAIIPQFKQQVLKSEVQLVEGQTLYSLWGGTINIVLCMLIGIIGFISSYKEKDHQKN